MMETIAVIGVMVVAAGVALAWRRRRARPRTAHEYLRLAARAFEKMRFEKAAELCREAIRLEPRSAEAHYWLGMSLALMERVDDAVGAFERAVECDPGSTDAEYALAAGYQQKGDLKRAEGHFRRVLELDPTSEDARQKLQGLYEEQPQTAEGRMVAPDRWEREDAPPGGEHVREGLARLYAIRKDLKEWALVVLVGGIVLDWMIINDVRKELPPHQSVWTSLDGVQWGFLMAPFAVLLLIVVGVLVTSVRVRYELVHLGSSGCDATRADWFARVAVEKREEEEFLKEEEELARLREEGRREGPWWRIELSGAHLVWWISLPATWTIEWADGESLSTLRTLGEAVLYPGMVLKIGFWWTYRWMESAATMRAFMRFYRWWGRGWQPVLLALLPGALGACWLAMRG